MFPYFNSLQLCKNVFQWIDLLRFFLEPLIHFSVLVFVFVCVYVCARMHIDVHLVLEMKEVWKEAR